MARQALNGVDFRRILIVKPSSLGDVVHALPTLSALRQRFPRAHIAWLVKKEWAELVERARGLDEVIAVDSSWHGWLGVWSRLRKARYDLAVDLQGLFRSGVTVWLTGAATRIGLSDAREGSAWFYTHCVPVPAGEIHAVDRYLLVDAAVGPSDDTAPEFSLEIWPNDREEVSALLQAHGIPAGTEWIAMNVGARWPTKRYPPEAFAVVADLLQEGGLGRVAFVGSSNDRLVVDDVMARMRTRAVNLAGLVTVGSLPALLASAALLVTNDSGPMHVAAAVGTSVVAVFGPTSPVLTGPFGRGHRSLQTGLTCSPCFNRTCRNPIELECLRTLAPQVVVEAVREHFAQRVAH